MIIQFFENKLVVLSQLLRNISSVDNDIKIKGRQGKGISVTEMHEDLYHIQVHVEKVVKKQLLVNDMKRKRR
ncbi:hypothetical protein CWS01_15045 [Niallia nealsonii]|uniref:Uncharacterized protein n=1 Tax=Niallia nealsonii TaxID=115979 RepID=A0A2N0Z0E7_9BACI|nr:hypothetical protein CWS01_15045 [Niallia nealsonii]